MQRCSYDAKIMKLPPRFSTPLKLDHEPMLWRYQISIIASEDWGLLLRILSRKFAKSVVCTSAGYLRKQIKFVCVCVCCCNTMRCIIIEGIQQQKNVGPFGNVMSRKRKVDMIFSKYDDHMMIIIINTLNIFQSCKKKVK